MNNIIIKAKKRDFVYAGILCVLLIVCVSLSLSATPYLTPSLPESMTAFGVYRGTLSNAGNAPEQKRQLDITRTISGITRQGKFESTVLDLQTLAESYDGFLKNQILTYRDGSWSGQTLFAIPVENDTAFTFAARQLIDNNGEVKYITQQIIDVTDTGVVVKYSAIKIELTEEPKPIDFMMQFEPAISFLTRSWNLISNWTIIAVPMFIISLAIWIFAVRLAIPLIKLAYSWSLKTIRAETGKSEEKPTVV